MEFQVEKLCEEIQDRLQSLAELRTEQIRKIRRECSRTLDSKDASFVIPLALGLIRTGDVISRIVAYELILNHAPALQSVGEKELVQLGLGMDSWSAVDTFGCYVAGPVWRAGQVPDRFIHSWTQSDDRWWRRAALVSTVPLNNKARGGSGDATRTLAVCSLLIQDRDDMVVKALSWALRELSKREREAVSRFILDHNQKLPARVIREVNSKLTKGLKNPRGTTKIMNRKSN